jgi:hypothetical protein
MWVPCSVVGGTGVGHPVGDGHGGSELHSVEGVGEIFWIPLPRPRHPGLRVRWRASGRAVVPVGTLQTRYPRVRVPGQYKRRDMQITRSRV